MFKQLRSAFLMLLFLTFLTGVIYPLLITGIAQVAFNRQANGSLVHERAVVGSMLIGQANADPRYFWGRPSAIANNPLPSGGSNLALTNAALRQQMDERAAAFRAAHRLANDTPIPADMLFASGSGLDPHISPDSARLQVGRVAEARNLDRTAVAALVEAHIEGPQLGLFGEPRVNVLLLNMALDDLQ
jgi:K+-transporting ATPase ATPase C chain